jgi:hypothetical protein
MLEQSFVPEGVLALDESDRSARHQAPSRRLLAMLGIWR